jgi:hypothetical protein
MTDDLRCRREVEQRRLSIFGARAVALAQGVFDPRAGQLEIHGVGLDSDEAPPLPHGGHAGRAGSHEWVDDDQTLWREPDAPFHDGDRLLRRVVPALALLRGLAYALPEMMENMALPHRAVQPKHFHVRERILRALAAAGLVPGVQAAAVPQARHVMVRAEQQHEVEALERRGIERLVVAHDRLVDGRQPAQARAALRGPA